MVLRQQESEKNDSKNKGCSKEEKLKDASTANKLKNKELND